MIQNKFSGEYDLYIDSRLTPLISFYQKRYTLCAMNSFKKNSVVGL